MSDNLKNALTSRWGNKVRSLLTMLGVVIGVSSVAILVSMGQGLKNDMSSMIEGLGANVLEVSGGNLDAGGASVGGQAANLMATDILTEKDVKAIAKLKKVKAISPITFTSGGMKFGAKTAGPMTIGIYPNALDLIQILKLSDGEMFKSKDDNAVVLGYEAKKMLFGKKNPINKKIVLDGRELTVVGTFKKVKSGGLMQADFDNLALIPFDTATSLNKGQVTVFRIDLTAKSASDVNLLKKQIEKALLKIHGEKDFSVMSREEALGLFGKFLNMATALISGIAAISLIVGGIGIMNIMFVSVTERTREIGLRKAVGATRTAILFQFLTEAVAVTLVGGLLGLVVAFVTDAIIKSQTSLNPVISSDVILLAVGISSFVGITFGLWPALRAARKDPIEALRYE